MNNYAVTFYYDSMMFGSMRTFTEPARGSTTEEVAEAVAKQLEKRKFISCPGGLIPVNCIGEIQITRVE